jgi:hypothetical protein
VKSSAPETPALALGCGCIMTIVLRRRFGLKERINGIAMGAVAAFG